MIVAIAFLFVGMYIPIEIDIGYWYAAVIGYFAVGLFLLTIAVVELKLNRRESAFSDFIFAALEYV